MVKEYCKKNNLTKTVKGLGDEGYILSVTDNKIAVAANNKNGALCGFKSLRQIIQELFHYAEKELLMARGVLDNSMARKAAYSPDSSTKTYIKELNERLLQVINDQELTATK